MFKDRCKFIHELCKDQKEFDALPKPPTFKLEGSKRSRSASRSGSPPRTPNAKAATRLEINFGTFCKKGLECTGRPAALGGDGTCTKKFHLNSSELAHVEGVKAHNRQVTKE